MPQPGPDDAPRNPVTPPPPQLRGGWDPPPPGYVPPAPVPRPPQRFSGLCAAGFAAGLLSVVMLVSGEGEDYSLIVATFALVLSALALLMTWDERPTNRWMAVVGLAAGLAPYALMLVLIAVLTGGSFGL